MQVCKAEEVDIGIPLLSTAVDKVFETESSFLVE